MSEKVSRLLDGDLAGETAKALSETASDANLRDRFTVYGLVGDVMRGIPVPDDGFSERIFQRMKREGVKMEPGFDPLKP